jgi:hypothetical protein
VHGRKRDLVPLSGGTTFKCCHFGPNRKWYLVRYQAPGTGDQAGAFFQQSPVLRSGQNAATWRLEVIPLLPCHCAWPLPFSRKLTPPEADRNASRTTGRELAVNLGRARMSPRASHPSCVSHRPVAHIARQALGASSRHLWKVGKATGESGSATVAPLLARWKFLGGARYRFTRARNGTSYHLGVVPLFYAEEGYRPGTTTAGSMERASQVELLLAQTPGCYKREECLQRALVQLSEARSRARGARHQLQRRAREGSRSCR